MGWISYYSRNRTERYFYPNILGNYSKWSDKFIHWSILFVNKWDIFHNFEAVTILATFIPQYPSFQNSYSHISPPPLSIYTYIYWAHIWCHISIKLHWFNAYCCMLTSILVTMCLVWGILWQIYVNSSPWVKWCGLSKSDPLWYLFVYHIIGYTWTLVLLNNLTLNRR